MKRWWLSGSLRLWCLVSISGYLSAIGIQPVQATPQTKAQLQGNQANLQSHPRMLRKAKLPITNTQLLVQSPAELIQVTGVTANSIDQGVEVILQTTQGEQLQITNRSVDNQFIADIPNAQLRLPSGDAFTFTSENPDENLTEITVTNFDANTIRVIVTGKTGLPTVELFDSNEGLILSFATVSAQPESAEAQPESQIEPSQPLAEEDESIELVVTGEQYESYVLLNASSATRTDTPIRDVPASIQVVPRQVIEDQQVTRLDEALRNVSGVTSDNFAGIFPNFTIRGFRNAPILRDGFRQYGSFQVLPEITNLESIEVLKGPASILYGDIDPGGLINAVSKKPLSEPFYAAEFQLGNRNFVRPRLDISGPLTPSGNLLYRLNTLYTKDDGFRGFDQANERFFIAPTIAWKLGDRTDITTSLEYTNERRPMDFGLVAFGDGVVNVPRDRITNEPDDQSEQNLFNIGYNLEHRFNDNWKLRNTFRYIKQDFVSDFYFPVAFNEVTGILQRSFAKYDIDIQTYSLQTNILGEFTTGTINHKILFGIDWNRQKDNFLAQFSVPPFFPLNIFDPVYGVSSRPNNVPVVADYLTESNRLGIYFQDQISLFDNLKLVAGLRYDNVEQTRKDNPTDVNPLSSETTQNDDAFTPQIGIVYQTTPELGIYANYSQSFTPNSGATISGNPLKPQTGQGYEFGLKAELLEGRLFGNLAYFDTTKQNVPTADPDFPNFLIATGEQRSRGIEVDVAGDILPGWNVIASYSYTNAETTKDNRIAIGNRLFNVPQHSAGLWTNYTIQSGNLQGLGLGIGFNYVGDREGDLANTFRLGSYFLTNAAVFYRRNNYRFAINFKNLFDVEYFQSSLGGRNNGIEPGDPFTVIGSFSVQF
ncbi:MULTISPECIES: TonB-dependent siderophore receptor [unclassified Nodularia (in: cyanobacteria)]|uniref:TonB-dependent siderophore receptor n=1 Tax=unclassified Nodularia (in: cyanobacteria) TaxID=2656917 RepID=UPI00187E8BD8|nr:MULTISPECIES: TonB-dependent siderophore receptor [unclassified Nodularia (in: cyanobacteria)]MBE9201706.1 TonB-dependent siderophore receptor [Nodularia sp. LEGE 06071]MCC2691265.1 TonB-dependent siderophore receptor [Nodularia sp. LEGE 04288]